jgi:hypothetical protein
MEEIAMPVRSPKNEYRGVNAHLHSHFQNAGGWEGFHTAHITDLARAISRALPGGYSVELEQSLQLREFHPDTSERLRRPQPDMTIFQRERGWSPAPAGNLAATVTQPLIATVELPEAYYLTAAVIYKILNDSVLGRPILRLELLSPSNKQGTDRIAYLDRRYKTLQSGLALAEIDYLHESPPVVNRLGSYRDREPGAYAYHITVSSPIPTFAEGIATIYGFGVDDPIPTVDLPLDAHRSIAIDLNAVYHVTFERISAYSYRVDYEQLPANFDRYSAADQDRIRFVMARVMA